MQEHAGSTDLEHHHLFRTRQGVCGIAWSARGVTRLQLPERTPAATERRLRIAHPEMHCPSGKRWPFHSGPIASSSM